MTRIMKNMLQQIKPTWLLALFLSLPTTVHAVSFSAGSATIAPGATVTVSISTTSFSQVSTFQFTLQWDSAVLEYVSASGGNVP